jgi:hypothetical protein
MMASAGLIQPPQLQQDRDLQEAEAFLMRPPTDQEVAEEVPVPQDETERPHKLAPLETEDLVHSPPSLVQQLTMLEAEAAGLMQAPR